ncbi:MAG: DUF2157 domain-containing protein [Gammaproteobacteria bacterium]|jgi:uncharacterized membrane protein|nr:DUF2157 domain-containing protein [Gammaproteobacteria bacterium]
MSMINHEHDSITLIEQQADRSIVDVLYRNGYINQQARDYCLELLYPHQRWGYWIAQVLAIVGCTLVLVGMIYFFAYNWAAMSSSYKFITIELALLCCVMGAWTYSLEKLAGQLFLMAACILVGVFLVVFGQVYQSGADAYELFIAWSLLTLPWVLISQFAALWIFWLMLVNVTLWFFWWQFVSPSHSTVYYISLILILVNAFFLVLRERLYNHNTVWLQHIWSRIFLVCILLILSAIPIEIYVLSSKWTNTSLIISACSGLVIQFLILSYYRFKDPDLWAYALTVISICLIILTASFRVVDKMNLSNVIDWLLMSLLTLGIFSLGAFVLRKTSIAIFSNKDNYA